MLQHDGVVVEELLEGVLLVMDLEGVRQQWVPVVEGVELGCDAVLVLKPLVEQQLRVKLQLEVVPTQVLHIILYNNLDCLSCRTKEQQRILALLLLHGMENTISELNKSKSQLLNYTIQLSWFMVSAGIRLFPA